MKSLYKEYLQDVLFGRNLLFLRICLLILLIISLGYVEGHGQDAPPDQTIQIKAMSGLKYSKLRFTVRPGATIKIVLKNTDEMLHNMLIVKPGMRKQVVARAESMGEDGPSKSFIPPTESVLASIPLQEPGHKESMLFHVPDEGGAYPYVCTFPGHGNVMYGAMYVTLDPDSLREPEQDPHIPLIRREELIEVNSLKNSPHPYSMSMPQVSRLFMPDASPASIAVGMKKDQSYCWDAGVCYLRYAWNGGYIDATKQWDAKAQEFAEIIGSRYYDNRAGFPFRTVSRDSVPQPEFKGYQLIDGYPQFIYRMGKTMVYESIRPLESGIGFRMSYHLEHVMSSLWYVLSKDKRDDIKTSKGQREGNLVRLSPEQAKNFTVMVMKK